MDPQNTSTQNDGIQLAISEVNKEFKEREIQNKAIQLGIQYIDLSIVPINDDVLRLVPEEISKEGNLIPFFQVGKKIRIAVTDPNNITTQEILEKIRKKNYSLNINLCSEEGLKAAQERYKTLKVADTSVDQLQQKILEKANSLAEEIKSVSEMPKKFEEIKTDLALALLNRKAITMNVSDLHFETQKTNVRVRGRIDGTLQEFFLLSPEMAKSMIRQIKFNANIVSNVPELPADGQFGFQVENRIITVRVSILPGYYGESIVMRYLDPKTQDVALEALGFNKSNYTTISTLLEYREGLVLVTGPTGSGKTTTLYSMLKQVNTPEKKIITLENPVEYEIEGIVQSNIQVEKGYGFAEALKSSLRQDPDIVLLGEIRDGITAETAMQSSLTGHLVLSTLHTNSAIESIVRLRDLQIPNYLISSSVRGIIAQRLLRKPCPHCAKILVFSEEQKKIMKSIFRPYVEDTSTLERMKTEYKKGSGCAKCAQSGYLGRSVISEVLVVSKELAQKIEANESTEELSKYIIQQKHKFLSYDAALKILQGETDFDEAIRVLGKNFLPVDFYDEK